MGIFEHEYPYTNAHELNLDFVLQKMAKINVEAVAAVTETVERHTEEITALQSNTSDIDNIRNNAATALSTAQMASVKADEIDDVKQDVADIQDELENCLRVNAPATEISYDNTNSHLSASNVQAAIDLLAESGGGGGGTASEVLYDNSQSGLSGGTVQRAIDELAGITMTATLETGETEIHFNNEAITTESTFDFYTTHYGVNPTVAHTVNGTLTLVFEVQDEPIGVKAVIK